MEATRGEFSFQMKKSIVSTLNEEQYAAATSERETVLILASAGSGKTRTLIGRTEHLLKEGAAPRHIVLLTFTNKAAGELIERLADVIGESASEVNAMTFHSFCNMRLRATAWKTGIPNYSIITSGDVVDIIRLIRDRNDMIMPEGFPSCGEIASIISFANNKMLSVSDTVEKYYNSYLIYLEGILHIVREYKAYKEDHRMYDFDDLLIVYLNLLKTNEDFRRQEEAAIDYLMVDEYQDTNLIQEEILRELRRENKNLCVVGDPQQSLYSFRGAEVDNILEFTKRWPDAKVIDLIKNYRSYAQICDKANEMIKEEAEFKTPAPMVSDRGSGPPVVFERPYNLFDEADMIIARITEYFIHNVPYKDMAVLYRSSREMVALESKLIRIGIPYNKIGGLKFMEKACIRDVLALLKVLTDYNDDKSWHRIFAYAPGMGKATSAAVAESISSAGYEALKTKAEKKYKEYLLDLYSKIREWRDQHFPDFIDDMTAWYIEKRKEAVRGSKMAASRKDDAFKKIHKDQEDIESLQLLIKPEHTTIKSFLDDIALENHSEEGIKDALTLSTIHSAKGLEWGYVWIPCCVDGIFPRTGEDARGLKEDQEELRCMYVAMTRAKDRLFISSPVTVTVGGKSKTMRPSHFLDTLLK